MNQFGYAPDPHPDEPLHHWLTRIANDSGVSVTVYLKQFNIDIRHRADHTRDANPNTLQGISNCSGVSVERLTLMTYRRWGHLGLNPDPRSRPNKGAAWATQTVNRTCPQCLTERNGTPRIQWRLLWSFACVRHERLLQPDGTVGEPVDAPPSALELQTHIDELLDGDRTSIASLGRDVPGWTYLADLGALARCATMTPDPEQFAEYVSNATGDDWNQHVNQFHADTSIAAPSARLGAAADNPLATAAALLLADNTLRQTSIPAAAATLHWLGDGPANELTDHAAERGISFHLWETLAANRKYTQPRAEFLKRASLIRRDHNGRPLAPLDPAKIPARIWAAVIPQDSSKPHELEAFSISAALLMMASDRRTGTALDALGLKHLQRRIQGDWADVLGTGEAADRTHAYLLQLHQALATGDVPINYARRRTRFPHPIPLGTQHQNRLLAALGQPATGHLTRHAEWFIWELLTGSDFLVSDPGLHMFLPHRQQYRRRRAIWATEQPAVLYELAELELLDRNINEPVTWAPIQQNGRWTLPADDGHRHLPNWHDTNRPLRKAARISPEQTNGLSINDNVALGLYATGPTADRTRRLLQRFEAVAQTGTVKEAATTLGISQGTLSVAIQDLERQLAKPLFDRTHGTLELTLDGHRLLRAIRNERSSGNHPDQQSGNRTDQT